MDLKGSYFRGDGQASSEWKAGTDGERAHLDFGVRANPATGKVGPGGRSGLVPATRWDSGLTLPVALFARSYGLKGIVFSRRWPSLLRVEGRDRWRASPP